eukprot:2551909-Amphidinium_carterae.1
MQRPTALAWEDLCIPLFAPPVNAAYELYECLQGGNALYVSRVDKWRRNHLVPLVDKIDSNYS